MNPYDIGRIFAEIEDAILKKLIDNFRKVRAKGEKGNYDVSNWRAEQVRSIRQFVKGLKREYSPTYKALNEAIEKQIEDAFNLGLDNAEEDIEVDDFFSINKTRMEALQEATINDLESVESAVFRKTEDAYRQIVYKAQVGLNSGLYTYDQAVDMATRDLINAGFNVVAYRSKDDRKKIVSYHTASDYAKMVLRTTMKRASLMAEGEMRTRLGIHTVYAVWRDEACPECMQFLGRIMVDDVYSKGTKAEAKRLGCITLSQAMEQGFLHPNCKDYVRTYDPERWKNDPENDPLKKTATKKELYEAKKREEVEEKLSVAETKAKKYKRFADNQLEKNRQETYRMLEEEWNKRTKEILPQLSSENKNLKEALEDVENTIRYRDVEYFVTLDDDGRVVYSKTSMEPTYVRFEDIDYNVPSMSYAMEDRIATHNHPSGSTFSAPDINLAVKNKIKEVRACHRDGVYILEHVGGGNRFETNFAFDFYDARKRFERDVTNVEWEEALEKYDRGSEELKEVADELNAKVENYRRKWLEEHAEEYGWRYAEEWIEN